MLAFHLPTTVDKEPKFKSITATSDCLMMSLNNLPQENNKRSLRNSKGQTAKTHCLPNTTPLSRSLKLSLWDYSKIDRLLYLRFKTLSYCFRKVFFHYACTVVTDCCTIATLYNTSINSTATITNFTSCTSNSKGKIINFYR